MLVQVEARQQVVSGRIFNIVSQRTRAGTILRLQVNFAPETITLAKEVRLPDKFAVYVCTIVSCYLLFVFTKYLV